MEGLTRSWWTVTLAKNISIIYVLNLYVMHVYDACMLSCILLHV
jgi:hypothetical protein